MEVKATIKLLERHQRLIKSIHEFQFQCPHCDFKASNKVSLQEHIKSIHQGNTHCKYKVYKATQNEDLQRHIKFVQESQKYICPYCDDKSTS